MVLAITPIGRDRRHAGRPAGVASARGHKVLAICNVVGSTIAREADGGIYLHAGPEIGVASTKAFTSQVTVLAAARPVPRPHRGTFPPSRARYLRRPRASPRAISQPLPVDEQSTHRAQVPSAEDFFYLGRQYHSPVALEGALKLKEISYIHAEGYPAAEMKHGPIALMDEKTPTVFVIPNGAMFEKTFCNLEEIKARKGPVIAVTTEDKAATWPHSRGCHCPSRHP